MRIAVVGDFFLDKYLDVDPTLVELSVETGKHAHQVVGIRRSPGAAGTIVCNLAALGAGTCTRSVSRATTARRMTCAKSWHGLAAAPIISTCDCGSADAHLSQAARHERPRASPPSTPATTRRTASVTSAGFEQAVVASLDQLLPQPDAVIVLDQVEEADCGVITRRVRDVLAGPRRKHRQIVFWADSRRQNSALLGGDHQTEPVRSSRERGSSSG